MDTAGYDTSFQPVPDPASVSILLYIITQLALISLQFCTISASPACCCAEQLLWERTLFLGLLDIKEHFLGYVRHFHSSDIKQMA